MEALIKKDNVIEFLIDFKDSDFDTSANFVVHKVISWGSLENNILETEIYLNGIIKYDGCCEFWFGDSDGYLYFSWKSDIEAHKNVIDAVWDICSKKIKGFDIETANH